jgi:hypothetical protein
VKLALPLAFWFCVLYVAACDPVLDSGVAALGGEASGVRPGPLHRPGQPCLLCHDGALGDPTEFSVAGTVFRDPLDKQAAVGARVQLKAADGSSFTLTSNQAGNFYVEPRTWKPVYPLEVSIDYESQTVSMVSNIGRDGACAGCHVDPAGPDSAGHVYAIALDAGVAQ